MEEQSNTKIMDSPLNTIIANDHYLLRESLKMILEETKKYKVLSEVSNIRLLSNPLNEKTADLILCDFHLPGGDIFEHLRNLSSNSPKLAIVVFIDGPISESLQRKLQDIPIAGLIPNRSSGDEILKVLEHATARIAV